MIERLVDKSDLQGQQALVFHENPS